MKRIAVFALIITLVFSLFSCGVEVETDATESGTTDVTPVLVDSDSETGPESETLPESESESENVPDALIEITPMPDVKADRIMYFPSDLGYEFFVYATDEGFGTIGADGKVISEPKFNTTTYYYDAQGNGQKYLGEYVDGDFNNFQFINSEGKFEKKEYYGWGMEVFGSVYWYNGAPLLFDSENGVVKYSKDAYLSYGYCRNYLGNAEFFFAPAIAAVKEIESYTIDDSGYSAKINVKYKSDRYGLFDVLTGKMLTGFIFDNVSNDVSVNGAIAVKLGDKWAYVDDSGSFITEYKYLAGDVIETYDWDKNDGSMIEVEQMYMPVNGYIVTVNENGYGLIDVTGKTVVENKYDFLSQVSGQNQFWILDDGVWSICEIKR